MECDRGADVASGDHIGARAMSTFYVLPSRPLLGQRFAEFLGCAFPGLDWPRAQWRDLAEMLDAEVLRRADVYVVYREDVPEGLPLDETLVHDFGAAAGDEVVEVSLGGRLAILTARRRRLGDAPSQVA
jgi:hypothetical protein